MSTKTWSKVSNTLSKLLAETLSEAEATAVMQAWNTKQTEISKILSGKAKKRDPKAPKKWKTGYIFYCEAKRNEVKEAKPGLSATDITSELGKMWGKVSDKEKKKYLDMSAKDKERYDKEMESYTPPEGEEPQKKGKKEREGPKRPLSAYMYFCQEMRDVIKKENPKMTGKEITSELGVRWHALDAEKKAPFEQKQQQDKSRYEAEKANLGIPDKKAKSSKKKDAEPVKANPVKKETTKEKSPPKEEKKTKGADAKKTPGFLAFSNEAREDIEGENPDWSQKKISAEVTKRWQALSDEDRAAYEAEAESSEVELDE